MIDQTTCIQAEIFTFEQANELKVALDSLPRTYFFHEERNNRWGLIKNQPLSHRYINPHDSSFPVVFGNDNQVIEENITLPYRQYKIHKILQKTIIVALQWISNEMDWKNQTKPMSMSIMQHYHLDKDEKIKGISWHRDASERTLVILLDDEQKWSGGDFLFRAREQEDQCFVPKCGHGVFFSNENTQHCVNPFTVNCDETDRTILTIHEKANL